jgi:hypothetical protein
MKSKLLATIIAAVSFEGGGVPARAAIIHVTYTGTVSSFSGASAGLF